jgi:hypothetical protein
MAHALKTCNAPAQKQTAPVVLVRWVLRRGNSHLTCQVDVQGRSSTYAISVVPHWDVASSVVETARSPRAALQRHAEIAKRLRDCGWMVAARSA